MSLGRIALELSLWQPYGEYLNFSPLMPSTAFHVYFEDVSARM